MTPQEPTTSTVSGRIGFASASIPVLRASRPSSPSVINASITTSEPRVLQRLYSQVLTTITGDAISVDCAIRPLARPYGLPRRVRPATTTAARS